MTPHGRHIHATMEKGGLVSMFSSTSSSIWPRLLMNATDLCQQIEKGPVDLSAWQESERLAERLLYWYHHLPSSLDLGDAPPHFLNLRVQYHYILISLYKLFTPGQKTLLPVHIIQHSKNLCIYSAREIAFLAVVHGRDFGFNRMYFVFAEGVALALFVLLTNLDNEKSSQAFFEAAVALQAASRRFLFSKGMMRMAYLTAIHTHVTLLIRARGLFKDFVKNSWKPEDANLFNSEIPNVALMIRPNGIDTDLIGLSALFERWEGASLEM